MSFAFSHVFESPYSSRLECPSYDFDHVTWYIQFELKDNDVIFSIFVTPHSRFKRKGVPWQIESDVNLRIGERETFFIHNVVLHESDHIDATEYRCYSKRLSILKEETFPENSIEGRTVVSIRVFNIRKQGIRKFEIDRSVSHCSGGSDMFLLLGNEKIYCHSQILQFNSNYFKEIIERGEMENLHTMFPFVVLDSTIPVHEFLELLHHIYHPSETIDDYNLAALLYWGTKFDVLHVLELCQNMIKSRLRNSSEGKRLEYFLLVWRYKLESLKDECKKLLLDEKYKFSHIQSSQHYQEMNLDYQFGMLENLLGTIADSERMETVTDV